MKASSTRKQVEIWDKGPIKLWDVNKRGNRAPRRFRRISNMQCDTWKDDEWTEGIHQGLIRQNTEKELLSWIQEPNLRKLIYEKNNKIWDFNTTRGDQQWDTNPDKLFGKWSEVSNYLWKKRLLETKMFDYQGLLVDKKFKGLPSRLISEITTRAGTQGRPRDMGVERKEMNATTRIEKEHDHQPSNGNICQEDTCNERNNCPTIPMRTVTKSNDLDGPPTL